MHDQRLVDVHVVAERAQRQALAGKDERVLLEALDRVARIARIGADRAVDGGVMQHVVVTLPAGLAADRAGGTPGGVERRWA